MNLAVASFLFLFCLQLYGQSHPRSKGKLYSQVFNWDNNQKYNLENVLISDTYVSNSSSCGCKSFHCTNARSVDFQLYSFGDIAWKLSPYSDFRLFQASSTERVTLEPAHMKWIHVGICSETQPLLKHNLY